MDSTMYIALWFGGDYHRVPYVNRNSDGDFKFNLGNFENDWNDNNCLLCFCYSFVFQPQIEKIWGWIFSFFSLDFFLDIFFPATEHTTNFVKKKY